MSDEELCETCEESIDECRCEWCEICKKNIDTSWSDGCRHMFWYDKISWWIGTGIYETIKNYGDELQKAFNCFIQDHPQIAEDLIWTIENGKMGFSAIHFTESIFGYDSVHCYLNGNWFGHLFTKDLENMSDEKHEHYSLFINWLIGLDADTEEANKLTVEWIKNAFFARNSHANSIQGD